MSTSAQGNWWKPCALLFGSETGPIIGGERLGLPTDINAGLQISKATPNNPWIGFFVDFPLGQENEDDGFGVRHRPGRHGTPVQEEFHRLTVKFPRYDYQTIVEPVEGEMRGRFPGAKKELSLVQVFLKDGAQVTVEGFGIPFANPSHTAEGWINRNEPLGDVAGRPFTLLDILEQRSFFFVVASPSGITEKLWAQAELPSPIGYPYGTDHTWDEDRYQAQLAKLKGPQFEPTWSFDDDNAHLTAVTQSQVQDVMWLDKAATEIRDTKFPVYFINAGDRDEGKYYFVLVPLTKEFRDRHDAAWRRLTTAESFRLNLYDSDTATNQEPSAEWDAKIKDQDAAGPSHPAEKHELVLFVRRPLPEQKKRGPDFEVVTFGTRSDANAALAQGEPGRWNCAALNFDVQLGDYKRKVDAVGLFHPDSAPSNAVIQNQVEFRMKLHRDLLRGTGFYDTLYRERDSIVDIVGDLSLRGEEGNEKKPVTRCLPIVNLFAAADEVYSMAAMEEALPVDRMRFRKYLQARPLGLGILTAGPGFGKTTALSIGALCMMATLGNIYGTGPTHVAVSNFAERVDRIASRVTDRYNEGKSAEDATRARFKLVVRGNKIDDEVTAFMNLLRSPNDGDDAAPGRRWGRSPSRWRLHLSLAFWLLVLLRSPGVRELRADDSSALWKLREDVDSRKDLARLRSLATGEMDWAEYVKGETVSTETILALMMAILEGADMLCTTPALSCQKPYKSWKLERTRGIAVDEAANITRPDLYSVWGNTLLPCLLAGDDKQLSPVVMTVKEKDAEGNFVNRFGPDGKISPLQFFKASGWPVFRLRVQLRMAEDLFRLSHKEAYPDVPFTYGKPCDINLPVHKIGRDLEQHVTAKYGVKPSPQGTLREVFVHCEGSRCFVDQVTRSKKNPDQVRLALGFLCDFVTKTKADPAKIIVIAPYKANVELINRHLKHSQYDTLKAMQPATTVDSVQGKEGQLVVVVMGTTHAIGPGFTTDEQRLNVMLSRQVSGLLVFGDINVAGKIDGKEKGTGKSKGADKAKGVTKFQVVTDTGEMAWVNGSMLRNVLTEMLSIGRVIRLEVSEGTAGQSNTATHNFA